MFFVLSSPRLVSSYLRATILLHISGRFASSHSGLCTMTICMDGAFFLSISTNIPFDLGRFLPKRKREYPMKSSERPLRHSTRLKLLFHYLILRLSDHELVHLRLRLPLLPPAFMARPISIGRYPLRLGLFVKINSASAHSLARLALRWPLC